jgi:hypothetical protein
MLILISYVFLDGQVDVYVLLTESPRPFWHGKFQSLTVTYILCEILKQEELLAFKKKQIYD